MRRSGLGREEGYSCKTQHAVQGEEANAEGSAGAERIWERASVEVLGGLTAGSGGAKSGPGAAYARSAGEI